MSAGNRLKSRSAVQNSVTPCARHMAAILASCTIGPPDMRPIRTLERLAEPSPSHAGVLQSELDGRVVGSQDFMQAPFNEGS